jgi:magnesium chelatase subunit D
MVERNTLPFSAIVGQEKLKKALLIIAVNPSIGGLLIKGPKGVAKSTAVRALANLLPEIEVVADCPFSCDPNDENRMCEDCKRRLLSGEKLPVKKRKMRIIDLPVSATLDRVVGSLNIKKAIEEGLKALQPGLLAEANRGILYIDEVNLLNDDIVNAILDAAASKVNIVEREGVSVAHPADFILIGTMNPEEGELRPQLLDRFGISVEAETPKSEDELIEIANRVEEFEKDPARFKEKFQDSEKALETKVINARKLLPEVIISKKLLKFIATVVLRYQLSNRAMIAAVKVAKTIATLEGRNQVNINDVKEALELVLPHRLKSEPLNQSDNNISNVNEIIKNLEQEYNETKEDNGKSENEKENKNEENGNNELYNNNLNNKEGNGNNESHNNLNENSVKINLDIKNVNSEKSGKSGISKSSGYLNNYNGTMLDFHSTLVNTALNKRRKILESDIVLRDNLGKGSLPILILLDTSKSMNFNKRIKIAMQISHSLLINAYKLRSKVGLITFSGKISEYVIPFSKNLEKFNKILSNIKPHGKTPLSHALLNALNILKKESKYSTPITFIITDGKANVSLYGNIKHELEYLSYNLGKISKVLIIDTNYSEFLPSYNKLIAEKSNGILMNINDSIRFLNIRIT